MFLRLRVAVREYLARVKEFTPNARLFLGVAALGGVNAGVQSVLLNLYVLSLGYTEGLLGRLLSLGPLAALPAAVVAGPLIDRWGTKRSMLAGSALAAAGALVLLLATPVPAMQAGFALQSAGGVLVYIAVPPFLARHSSPRERTHLFGVVAAAYVVSTAVGSALGGFLPPLLGWTGATSDQAQTYRVSLLGVGLLSALGIPLLAMVREAPRPAVVVGASAGETTVLRPAAQVARLVKGTLGGGVALLIAQFVVADGLIRLGGNLVVPFFNVFFVRHLGASEAWYGSLRFLERVIEVVAMLLVPALAGRFGPVATIAVTQALSIPMLLALGFAPTLAVASAAFLVRGTLMEMTVPVRDSFMMDVVPDNARATANAALMLAGYAIAFVSTRIGGHLFESGQIGLAFSATAVLYAASALLYWRFFGRRPEAAPGHRANLVALAHRASARFRVSAPKVECETNQVRND